MTYLYDRNRICYVDVKLNDQPNLVIPRFASVCRKLRTHPQPNCQLTPPLSIHRGWFGPSLERCRYTRQQTAERAILVQINLSGSSRKVGLTFRGWQLERAKRTRATSAYHQRPSPNAAFSSASTIRVFFPCLGHNHPQFAPLTTNSQIYFAFQTRLADLPFTNANFDGALP